jgi:hypothetical protein
MIEIAEAAMKDFTLRLPNAGAQTTSGGPPGGFSLPPVLPGDFTIRASKAGYDTVDRAVHAMAIQKHHVKLFSAYLERLRSTPDGEGSLLDHSIILFGSGLSNSDRHTHAPLPTLVAGGGAGTIRGGRHLVYPDDTPLTNLHLTLLDKMRVPIDKLGDSTGKFRELSEI